jgi:hypothetical protein
MAHCHWPAWRKRAEGEGEMITASGALSAEIAARGELAIAELVAEQRGRRWMALMAFMLRATCSFT